MESYAIFHIKNFESQKNTHKPFFIIMIQFKVPV